jgi:hypothetical protein
VAPEQEGVYAFADPIEQNCWAGMLLVVDVERPKAVPAASAPAPAPSTGKKNGNNSKKPASAAAAVPAAAPAPAPAAAAAVSVASVSPSQQAAFVEGGPSFVEEEGGPAAEMTPRERHAARVAEREAAREQRQMQRAVEEGRVDFEQQHVIEDSVSRDHFCNEIKIYSNFDTFCSSLLVFRHLLSSAFNAALFKGEREGTRGEMKEEHSSTNQPVSFRFLEGKERSFSEIHTLETRKKKQAPFLRFLSPFLFRFPFSCCVAFQSLLCRPCASTAAPGGPVRTWYLPSRSSLPPPTPFF